MKRYEITPTQFRVADFLAWQKDGSLVLNPPFQRRSVWRPGARSYFLDTVVRGLPIPLIFIRERVDLESQRVLREVVDGQQRLRTLFGFIDEGSLADFRADRDRFMVSKTHNAELAGRTFKQLEPELQTQILEYRFSVQILPRDVEDREVLQIFARMNSTGVKLNEQELRNAQYFGEFKTHMYRLAYEQLERWLAWRLFSEDQLSRMLEVELVSDLVINMMRGLTGKSQNVLNRIYEEYDDSFEEAAELGRRFRRTIDMIDDVYGPHMTRSIFRRQMHFFSLFVYFYDRMYGLQSSLGRRKPNHLSPGLQGRIAEVDRRFKDEELPRRVLEAISGAATDLRRRRIRLRFLASICDGKAS